MKRPNKTDTVDAIRVSIDHRVDYSVHVFFPYAIEAGGGVKLEAPFASKASSFAFRGEPLG